MSRQFRTRTMQPRFAAVLGGVVVLTALIVVAVAAARPLAPSGQASPLSSAAATAHSCLVMTGSGDPAFVKNFNPFTATGLPSGQFVRGAVYEGLTVSPEGGKPTLPWLARSWKWSNGNKTLTLQIAKGVKWSDGKALTVRDVVYSLTGRPPEQDDGHPRHHPPRDERRLGQGEGRVRGRDQPEDARLAVHRCDAQRRHRDPAAHLVEGQGSRDVHEPDTRSAPARSRGSPASRRRTTCCRRTRATGRPASR